MDAIANGEYGPELKLAYGESAMPGVCVESKLYVCESCGRWEVLPDATLYEPLDVEAELSKERWGKSAREARHIPYLMPDDLKRYRVIGAYSPTCECGAAMKESARIEGRKLACPKCGTMNTVLFAGNWD